MRRIAIAALAATALAVPTSAQAVINGGPADRADTPWFVSYGVDGGRCGGAIIDARWIVTAAHCAEYFVTWQKLDVRVNPAKFGKGPTYSVDRAILNPGFEPGSQLPNDIALLHVTRDLPSARVLLNANASAPRKGQKLRAFGFGATSRTNTGSTTLRVADVLDQSGPNGVCGSWKRNRFDPAIQLCANDPVKRIDTCGGDSGGPLIQAKRRLVGIVSSGATYCNGNPKKPGIYTRVSAFRDWIEQSKVAAQIVASSAQCPPPDRACEVAKGKSMSIELRNAGEGTAKWALGKVPPTVAVSSGGGSLAAGKSTVVTVTATSSAKVCAPFELTGTNLVPTTYRIYVNGGLDGC